MGKMGNLEVRSWKLEIRRRKEGIFDKIKRFTGFRILATEGTEGAEKLDRRLRRWGRFSIFLATKELELTLIISRRARRPRYDEKIKDQRLKSKIVVSLRDDVLFLQPRAAVPQQFLQQVPLYIRRNDVFETLFWEFGDFKGI